jgi:hypothetical protein
VVGPDLRAGRKVYECERDYDHEQEHEYEKKARSQPGARERARTRDPHRESARGPPGGRALPRSFPGEVRLEPVEIFLVGCGDEFPELGHFVGRFEAHAPSDTRLSAA